MGKERVLENLLENAGHGTRRQDVEAAYDAGVAAERERIRRALQDLQAACRSHNYYAHAIVAAGLTPSTTTAVRRGGTT